MALSPDLFVNTLVRYIIPIFAALCIFSCRSLTGPRVYIVYHVPSGEFSAVDLKLLRATRLLKRRFSSCIQFLKFLNLVLKVKVPNSRASMQQRDDRSDVVQS